MLNSSKDSSNKDSNNFEIETDLKPSKSMYELIYSLKLGNLSAMKDLPRYYILMILQYIMQVSLGFIHAHSQDLSHGNFNLSKVIA